MRYKRPGRHRDIHIDMTPMVDVMMLLIIFFIMSTTFAVVHPAFSVNLPTATAEKTQPEQHVVLINKDGRVAIDGQLCAKSELAAYLRNRANTAATVSVQADEAASHGQVVEIMNEIRKAGITKIAIAVNPKG
jgi:biopolymer transport protein ExbD